MKKGKKREQRERRLDGPSGSAYVRAIRDALYLHNWTIRVQDAKAKDRRDPGLEDGGEVVADIEPMATRHLATLRLFPAYWAADREGQRHAITHELLHVLFQSLRVSVDAMGAAIEETSWRHLHRAYRLAEENAIDDLAALLGPSLPLPIGDS